MPLASPIHATCPTHLILIDLITCIIVGEEIVKTHCVINYNNVTVMPMESAAHLHASGPYNLKHLQLWLSKSINGESSTHTNSYIEFGKKCEKNCQHLTFTMVFRFV
jgi:hypothetical protein